MELVGRISAHPLLWLNPIWNDRNITRNPPNAATGAANRLAQEAPMANPTALNAVTAATPTATHHQGGVPATPWWAYHANMTPTKIR